MILIFLHLPLFTVSNATAVVVVVSPYGVIQYFIHSKINTYVVNGVHLLYVNTMKYNNSVERRTSFSDKGGRFKQCQNHERNTIME